MTQRFGQLRQSFMADGLMETPAVIHCLVVCGLAALIGALTQGAAFGV